MVCTTRADVHYKTIKPSIEQGKDVFVEWPLAQNLSYAEELRTLAQEKGCRTMVGLQGRESPVILKVKSLVEQGKIGKVLSSSVIAVGATNDRNTLPASLKYFTDKSVGGNVLTIYIGHSKSHINWLQLNVFQCMRTIANSRTDVLIVRSSQRLCPICSWGVLISYIKIDDSAPRGQYKRWSWHDRRNGNLGCSRSYFDHRGAGFRCAFIYKSPPWTTIQRLRGLYLEHPR